MTPMVRSTKDLHEYAIRATDDDVGGVSRFLFEPDTWTVRYLVVATGSWLDGREVLLSPLTIEGVDEDDRVLRLRVPRAIVEDSPAWEPPGLPTRDFEARLASHYGYPPYWQAAGIWGPAGPLGPNAVPPAPVSPPPEPRPSRAPADTETMLLRDSAQLIGSHIQATDGSIGHVEDFLLDAGPWSILYMLVDTSNWWVGRKVLVSPRAIAGVDWTAGLVRVGLTKDEIRASPKYDPAAPPGVEEPALSHQYPDRHAR